MDGRGRPIVEALASQLAPDRPVYAARAPGRIDVMGGIADYSGSLVLQLPTEVATYAVAQWREDDRVRICSGERTVERSRSWFAQIPRASRPAAAASQPETSPGSSPRGASPESFACEKSPEPRAPTLSEYADEFAGDSAWAAYALGPVLALLEELSMPLPRGFDLALTSEVPESKGVASSASLEVAVASVLAAMLAQEGARVLSGMQIAALCQRAEHQVARAPCGIMDQATVALGLRGRLFALQCRPHEVLDPVLLPESLRFFGVDSGQRHAVSGSDYATVRAAAFMGRRILRALRPTEFLCEWTVAEFEALPESTLPESILGAAFRGRWGEHEDPATSLQDGRTYAVRAAVQHAIGEHERVSDFAKRFASPLDEQQRRALGAGMFASDQSYRDLGLGSPATDDLVDRVRALGPERGLYGARITGGGSGGTVAILAAAEAEEELRSLASTFAAERGAGGRVLTGSSDGAVAFGAWQRASLRGGWNRVAPRPLAAGSGEGPASGSFGQER